MDIKELTKIAEALVECEHYLVGARADKHVTAIAAKGANEAVKNYQNKLYEKLEDEGLALNQ